MRWIFIAAIISATIIVVYMAFLIVEAIGRILP